MELKCEDCYFYPNGSYTTISKWKSGLLSFDNDLKEVGTAIRIFGTQSEIDKALDEYIDKTGLNLDESYNYELEKEGTRFYNKERNEEIAKRLKQYEELYKENKKALFLNLN